MWFQKTNCVSGIGQGDSGTGYFTVAFAELVGPIGRMQAVDLQPQQLRIAKRRCRRAGVFDRVQFLAAARFSWTFEIPRQERGGAIEGHAARRSTA